MPSFKPSFHRRCKNHDYTDRWIYLITILKNDRHPALSSITQDPRYSKVTPIVNLSPFGKIVNNCLTMIKGHYTHIKILCSIIMPDHIHFVIFITKKTDIHLGTIIGHFTALCTHTSIQENLNPSSESFFQTGYNDKIAFKEGAKDAFYFYTCDNPRRYLVKRMHPEYFWNLCDIKIEEDRYHLYGNIFLLDNPVKSVIKVSRKVDQTPFLNQKEKEWEETIRCQGVLISPFIHPHERHYFHKAIEEGANIIMILDHCFTERSKPHKQLFELCEQGRLLIVSVSNKTTPTTPMPYPLASKMNQLAAKLAALPPGRATLCRRQL